MFKVLITTWVRAAHNESSSLRTDVVECTTADEARAVRDAITAQRFPDPDRQPEQRAVLLFKE